mgnify:CR=1 FL=1
MVHHLTSAYYTKQGILGFLLIVLWGGCFFGFLFSERGKSTLLDAPAYIMSGTYIKPKHHPHIYVVFLEQGKVHFKMRLKIHNVGEKKKNFHVKPNQMNICLEIIEEYL